MSCNQQLDLSEVVPAQQGLLEDPRYIEGSDRANVPTNQNVAPLSVSVAASLLAQYVSFNVAPAGLGDPGPLHYALNTHCLEHLEYPTRTHCSVESDEGAGDYRVDLTGHHEQAEQMRKLISSPDTRTRLLRQIDDWGLAVTEWLDRLGE